MAAPPGFGSDCDELSEAPVRTIGETMSTVRKLGVIGMVVFGMTFTACTSSSAPAPTSSTSSTSVPPDDAGQHDRDDHFAA